MKYQQWQQHKDRPIWVRNNRDELDELVSEPVPDSIADVPGWVQRFDSTVSKALKEQEGESDE